MEWAKKSFRCPLQPVVETDHSLWLSRAYSCYCCDPFHAWETTTEGWYSEAHDGVGESPGCCHGSGRCFRTRLGQGLGLGNARCGGLA